MDSRKKAIYTFVGMIVLFIVVGVLYTTLSDRYVDESSNIGIGQDIGSSQSENQLLPDFIVYDDDGNEVKISDYKGKPVVVNFWASWCPPCIEEMPYFQAAYDKYSSNDVEILMVNTIGMRGETKEDAEEFIEENSYNMNVLFDEDMDAVVTLGINSIPRTLFIDEDGYITYNKIGYIDSEETLFGYIDNLIK